MPGNRIFLSAASDDFAPLRLRLAAALQRGGLEVEHQKIFPQVDEDTVRKLSGLVGDSRVVIHIVGDQQGAVADEDALADLLISIPAGTLLAKPRHAKLKEALGDLSGITYTQWEAFLALHHGVPLLVYAPAHAWDETKKAVRPDFPQAEHLARLRMVSKYPEWCADEADFVGKILSDIYRHPGGTSGSSPTQSLATPRFLHHAAELFLGREDELAMLDQAWDDLENKTNVLGIIAWGGVGKTALLAEWISRRFIAKGWKNGEGEPEPLAYFDWSFYEQGTAADEEEEGRVAVRTGNVGDFFEKALTFFGDEDPNMPGKGERLAELVRRRRALVILDGLEPLQYPFNHPALAGRIIDQDLDELLRALAVMNPGLCVVTSRQPLKDLSGWASEMHLEELPIAVAVLLLRRLEVKGTDEELEEACEAFGRHALSITR